MTTKDLLATARDVLVIVGIVLFAFGYFYRHAFLDALGVPTHATSSEVNETVIYAIGVLQLEWLFFVVFAAIVLAVFAALKIVALRSRLSAENATRMSLAFGALATVCLMLFGSSAAQIAGRRVAHDVMTGKGVHFSTFSFDSDVPPEYRKLLTRDFGDLQSGLVIVAENDNAYFIVVTQPGLPDDQWLSVYRLPKAKVRAVRTFQE